MHGKFIYYRTYNSVGLNKVSQLVVQIANYLYGRVFGKIHHCRLKFIVVNRYRSNCNSVRFLLKGQLQN